jgi:hypothetical protein
MVQASLGKKKERERDHISKITKAKRAGSVAHGERTPA